MALLNYSDDNLLNLKDCFSEYFLGRFYEAPMSARVPDDVHYAAVLDAIEMGRLIPFFGAGVNLCNRPPDYDRNRPWDPTSRYLPSGRELAIHMAANVRYPANDKENLLRVSQFFSAKRGQSALDEFLHRLFHRDFSGTDLHHFFATLPAKLRAKGFTEPNLLIITTNYDTMIEEAFKKVEEPYDVLSYIREGENKGKFLHFGPTDVAGRVVASPNNYDDVRLTQRSVILKIHGAVERNSMPQSPSFVITEDNYIDYLASGNVARQIPVNVAGRFVRGQFLFLGYSLCDWNMRAFYRRVQEEQSELNRKYRSWAVQLRPDEIEQTFWDSRGVEIVNSDLLAYLSELQKSLDALPQASHSA